MARWAIASPTAGMSRSMRSISSIRPATTRATPTGPCSRPTPFSPCASRRRKFRRRSARTDSWTIRSIPSSPWPFGSRSPDRWIASMSTEWPQSSRGQFRSSHRRRGITIGPVSTSAASANTVGRAPAATPSTLRRAAQRLRVNASLPNWHGGLQLGFDYMMPSRVSWA